MTDSDLTSQDLRQWVCHFMSTLLVFVIGTDAIVTLPKGVNACVPMLRPPSLLLLSQSLIDYSLN